MSAMELKLVLCQMGKIYKQTTKLQCGKNILFFVQEVFGISSTNIILHLTDTSYKGYLKPILTVHQSASQLSMLPRALH